MGGLHTIPTCLSTVNIRLFDDSTNSLDVTSFSTARTTPSLHRKPIAVPPFSTAFEAYSTYIVPPKNSKPSLTLDIHRLESSLQCQRAWLTERCGVRQASRRKPLVQRGSATWKILPSGLNIEFAKSYPVPIEV